MFISSQDSLTIIVMFVTRAEGRSAYVDQGRRLSGNRLHKTECRCHKG